MHVTHTRGRLGVDHGHDLRLARVGGHPHRHELPVVRAPEGAVLAVTQHAVVVEARHDPGLSRGLGHVPVHLEGALHRLHCGDARTGRRARGGRGRGARRRRGHRSRGRRGPRRDRRDRGRRRRARRPGGRRRVHAAPERGRRFSM
ncbi:hypothetical protein D8M39_02365 [Kocuria sp. HSID17590]|nr:hypothetical protein D8M39_02365 [Kocuria sp. HSID17590]